MKTSVIITIVVLISVMLISASCQSGGDTDRIPVPSEEIFPTGGVDEAPDDIMTVPGGGPAYRANVHQSGEENPWPPIEIAAIYLGSGSDEAHISYRDNIETKSGETRNNVIKVTTPGKEVDNLSLYTTSVPSGITLSDGMHWSGPRSGAAVLVIEISLEVKSGQYNLEIGLEINNRDYGTIPCLLSVIE